MSASDRQRRYRERQRAGVRVVQIECDAELIEALADAKFLRRAEADDPEAVRAAIVKLHDFLKRRANG